MPLPRSRALTAAAALAVAAVLTSCGSAPPGRPVTQGTLPDGSPFVAPVDAGYGPVDVLEVLALLDRHGRRRALTDLVVERSTDPEVRELARRVAADAKDHDARGRQLLDRWGQPEVGPVVAEGPLGTPQQAETTMASLRATPPGGFERAALEVLLLELQTDVVSGAIARNDGRDDAARRLGHDTVESAQLRLERVRQLLGEAPPP